MTKYDVAIAAWTVAYGALGAAHRQLQIAAEGNPELRVAFRSLCAAAEEFDRALRAAARGEVAK